MIQLTQQHNTITASPDHSTLCFGTARHDIPPYLSACLSLVRPIHCGWTDRTPPVQLPHHPQLWSSSTIPTPTLPLLRASPSLQLPPTDYSPLTLPRSSLRRLACPTTGTRRRQPLLLAVPRIPSTSRRRSSRPRRSSRLVCQSSNHTLGPTFSCLTRL